MIRALVATVIAATVLISSTTPAVRAQEATFREQSDLVVLYVNVFNGKSDAVPNLPESAFTVVEDGNPQPITFFDDTDVPVAVGLVIDNSSSMLTHQRMVLAGGVAFAKTSHPDDEAFTLSFNEHVRSGLPPSVEFTNNRSLLQAALMRYPAGGKTAMYDAVIEGLERLQDSDLQKRVLLVLSDADDNASHHSKQDMLHRVLRSDSLIYTIYTGALSPDVGDPGVMKKLADMSGGTEYEPNNEAETVSVFKEIATNIRRGYRIGYVPRAHADGSYHEVKVLVRQAGYKNLKVRVRSGYTAEDESGQ